jgi:Leucine-rich repeat (LRR) protein
LTLLNAHNRNISSVAGLEAARNLNTLLLYSKHLTDFSLRTLTNLVSLDLSGNSLTNVSLPAGMANLFSLLIANNPLTQLTLPSDLTRLEELDLNGNQIASFQSARQPNQPGRARSRLQCPHQSLPARRV